MKLPSALDPRGCSEGANHVNTGARLGSWYAEEELKGEEVWLTSVLFFISDPTLLV